MWNNLSILVDSYWLKEARVHPTAWDGFQKQPDLSSTHPAWASKEADKGNQLPPTAMMAEDQLVSLVACLKTLPSLQHCCLRRWFCHLVCLLACLGCPSWLSCGFKRRLKFNPRIRYARTLVHLPWYDAAMCITFQNSQTVPGKRPSGSEIQLILLGVTNFLQRYCILANEYTTVFFTKLRSDDALDRLRWQSCTKMISNCRNRQNSPFYWDVFRYPPGQNVIEWT